MTATFDPPQPNAALVVGPDDMLVVSFRHALSPEEFARIRADFEKRFPEIAHRMVLVGNADQIAVIHKDPTSTGAVAG